MMRERGMNISRLTVAVLVIMIGIMGTGLKAHARTYDGSLRFDLFTYNTCTYYEYGATEALFVSDQEFNDYGHFVGDSLVIPKTVVDAAGNTRTVVGICNLDIDYVKDIYVPSTVQFVWGSPDLPLRDSDTFRSIHFQDVPDLTLQTHAIWQEGLTTIVLNTDGKLTMEEHSVYCENLDRIFLPKNIEMDPEALYYNNNIKYITNVPGEIYLHGASNEFALETIIFSPVLTEVDGILFDGKNASFPNLKKITIPSGVKKIGNSAFEGIINGNVEISLPSTLTEIGSYAFADCTGLKDTSFLPNLTSIGEGAFYGCSELNGSVSMQKLDYVGNKAFFGCRNLKLSVRHPGDLLYQYKNSGITDIVIDLNKAVAGGYIIYPGGLTGCPNLKSIQVVGGDGSFKTVDDVLYVPIYKNATGEMVGWSLSKYPAGKSGGSYKIPADVKGLGGFAFEGCRFTSIEVPPTVEMWFTDCMASIDEPITYYCPFDNMQTAPVVYVVSGSYFDESYPSGRLSSGRIQYQLGPEVPITYNLNGGKNNSSNPAKIRGGMEVTLKDPTRDGYTFVGWKTGSDDTAEKDYILVLSGEEIIKGTTVEAVWEKTAADQKKDDTKAASDQKKTDSKEVGSNQIIVGNAQFMLYNSGEAEYQKPRKKKASVSIPATVSSGGKTYKVTSIAANAFKKDTKLKNLSIGKNVKTIGKNAFSGCKNLAKVTGAKNVNSIGSGAFSGCGKLKSMSLGSKVTTIGAKAFYNNKALTKITIPSKTKKIGKSAFQGCKKLKTITVKSTKLTDKNVGANAFKGIQAKVTVTVPKKSLKAYKKWLKKKGLPKKAKIK